MTDKIAVFYDTEFTTWKGAIENGWSGPGQFKEIVQIGAGRFDFSSMKIIDEFSILVKPVKNPVLSDYFIDLTGITNEDIQKDGVDLRTAVEQLLAFAGHAPLVSYGGDHVIVNEDCKLKGIGLQVDGINIRPWILEHGASHGITPSINSGKLAATLGVKIDTIQEHNALHDVRSIAAAYAYLVNQAAPPFFI